MSPMTTATDTFINGATTAQETATAATKAAAETVAKATSKVATRATQVAVDNATAAFETAAKAVKTAQANGAEVTAAATAAMTKVANTTVSSLTQADGTNPATQAQAKVQEFVDAFTAQAKQGVLTWLDAYAKGFDAFLDLQTQIAQATKVEAVTEFVAANVGALTQLNTSYVDTVRDLLQ